MSALDPIAQILTNGTYPSNSCLTNEVLCLVAAPDGDCPPCDIITPTMMDFLNITSMDTFFQAYCTNAPSDDSCLFGLCPNSDVAGPLIRVSSYLANFCTALLVFYSPNDAITSFWSQVLSGFSLLIACAVSSAKGNLTRFHASIVVILTGSPLFFYLCIYSAISFKWRKHRMNGLVGDGQWFRRLVMIISGAFWICMFVIILLPDTDQRIKFSQASCVANNAIVRFLYILPFPLVETAWTQERGVLLFAILVVAFVVIGWIVGIWLQREKIWPSGKGWTPRPGKVWAVTGREYPFIHFISVVLIPNLYWIAVIEAAMIVSHADNEASPSTYGQILSVFVAVPSMVSTLTLYPKFLSWFFHLTWVRRVPFLRELGQKWEEKRRQNGNASAKGSFQGSITGVVEEYDMSRFSSSQLDLKTERSNLVTIGH